VGPGGGKTGTGISGMMHASAHACSVANMRRKVCRAVLRTVASFLHWPHLKKKNRERSSVAGGSHRLVKKQHGGVGHQRDADVDALHLPVPERGESGEERALKRQFTGGKGARAISTDLWLELQSATIAPKRTYVVQ